MQAVKPIIYVGTRMIGLHYQ